MRVHLSGQPFDFFFLKKLFFFKYNFIRLLISCYLQLITFPPFNEIALKRPYEEAPNQRTSFFFLQPDRSRSV